MVPLSSDESPMDPADPEVADRNERLVRDYFMARVAWADWRESFPDHSNEIEDVIATGERIVFGRGQ